MNVCQQIELQASAQQWVDDIMRNYGITATEMADALSKVLVILKDKSLLEYLAESAKQREAQQRAQQEVMQSQAPQEEEGYDD